MIYILTFFAGAIVGIVSMIGLGVMLMNGPDYNDDKKTQLL